MKDFSFEKAFMVVVVFVTTMAALFSGGDEILLIDSLVYLITGTTTVFISWAISRRYASKGSEEPLWLKFVSSVLIWIFLIQVLTGLVGLIPLP